MTLGEYLESQRGTVWQAGVNDCCTFPGDWVRSWGRGDPMAAWRGTYSTDDEAEALVAAAGGLVVLWRQGLAGIATLAGDLAEGDVGVIRAVAPGGEAIEIGAIWTGRRWAFRVPAGLAFASADCVEAWTRG